MVFKTKYDDDNSLQGVDESLKSSGGRHKLKNVEQMKDINSIYDTDIRNAELLIDKHSEDPFGVMRIQEYDCVPMAKEIDDVVIRVEASTVSDIDCKIRNGSFKWKFGQKPAFPLVPGLDCVGIVTSTGELAMKYGIEPGSKVAALSMNGCTAKYITLKFDEVIKIPESLDSAEAVVVIRTYTAAFQALMTTIDGHDRYKRKPLDGEKILIVGPCGAFERALVELALYLGANSVNFWCISSSNKSHENYIRMLGARPLSEDADDWIDKLEGKIDIVIDSVCVDRYEYSFKSLKGDGILVCTGMSTYESSKSDFISSIEKSWVTTTCSLSSNFHFYDGIIKSFENNRKTFMKDLIYLLSILDKGKIKPKVGMRIPMKKVADAQDKLEKHLESLERRGVTVVEPWLMP